MKTVVCLKEVSSRDTRLQVSPDQLWIDESNVSFEISECDEFALEEGLKLKDSYGGELLILTIGSDRAEKVMRKALAKGADRGLLVADPGREVRSPRGIASIMTAVLRDEECDLILTGTQSDDLGYAQTGVMLAEMLGIPHATLVMEIEADPEQRRLLALREMESGWFERLELPLPALLTVQAGSSPLRFPALKGIMQARRKEIRRIELDELELDRTTPSGLDIRSVSVPKQDRKGEMLQGEPAEVVKQLVNRLRGEAKLL